MASNREDPTGIWWDTDDHLLTRARMVRKASIKWAPPQRHYPVLYSVLLKAPKHPGDKWLAVFKATLPDGDRVAFFKGSTLMAALANGLGAVFSNRIDWKVETPWKPHNG